MWWGRGESTLRDGTAVLLLCVLLLALGFVALAASFVATFDSQIPPTDPTKVIATVVCAFASLGCLAVIMAIVARVRGEDLWQFRYGTLFVALVLGAALLNGAQTAGLGTDSSVPGTVLTIAGGVALGGGIYAFVKDSRRLAALAFGAGVALAVIAIALWLGQAGWPDCEAPELLSGDEDACFTQP